MNKHPTSPKRGTVSQARGTKLCGARTRAGSPCDARGFQSNGRCKWHGGASTGPVTAAGKAAVALNLPRVRDKVRAAVGDVAKKGQTTSMLLFIEPM
jgi:hypothetical protein